MATSTTNACRNLVLDAGPLLMLSPLRGLAETFLTVPQVLEELKDNRAREHFEKLGLIAGVNVRVQSPDPESLAQGAHFLLIISVSLKSEPSDTVCEKDGRLFCPITC
jgi:RNA-binding protein NOB1